MRKTLLATIASAGAITVLAGCTSPGYGTNEQVGMVVGGALGGLLGDQVEDDDWRTAAIIGGTIAGSFIGGSIGRSMDTTDRLRTGQTLETVRTGVSSSWRNPDTGNEYTVIPTNTYETASGPCREYTINAVIDGRTQKVRGTACRQSDGTWQTMS
ncbi:MAG: RT0821/Lpp0805 family surface protein [Thiohalocapsa sp.]|jgi:surface antigen